MSTLPPGYSLKEYAFDMYQLHVILGADWVAQNIFYYFDLCKPFPRTGTPTDFTPMDSALLQRRLNRLMVIDLDAVHQRHAAEWAELVDEFDTYAQDLGDWYRNEFARRVHESYVAANNCAPIVWGTVNYSAGTDHPTTPLVSPGTLPTPTGPSRTAAHSPPRSLRSSSRETVRGRRSKRPTTVVTSANAAHKTTPIRPPRSRSSTERCKKKQRTNNFVEHTESEAIDLEAHYGYHDAFPRRRWELPSPVHRFRPVH